jgi:hypothetical protein
MTLWCLKSLLWHGGETFDVWLADGGGLEGEPSLLLRKHFPGIRILTAAQLDAASSLALRDYRWSFWLRHERRYAPSKKLFDPLLHIAHGRFLLLDSDVLFFSRPVELIRHLKNENNPSGNVFNIEKGQINSGVAVINPTLLSFDRIEKCLDSMSHSQRTGWVVEQDVYAKLSEGQFVGLSSDYAVQPITDNEHGRCIACHYIGVVRQRFFSQGVTQLNNAGFIDSLKLNGV